MGPTGLRRKLVFAALMLGMLLAVLDQTVTGTAAWVIVKDIGGPGGLAEFPWLAGAYLMSSTVATPLAGRASDHFGRGRVYLAVAVLFTAGSLLAGAATGLGTLIGGRALQGLGAGGLIALTFAIVSDLVPPRDRGRYTGLAMSAIGVASICGPLIGGFFAGNGTILGVTTTWRWVFYVNLPLGLAAAVTVAVALGLERGTAPERPDYLGAALLVAGSGALMLIAELTGGSGRAAASPAAIAPLAVAGVVLLALFGLRERRTAAPVMPLALFRDRGFRIVNLVSCAVGAALLGSIFYLTLYLQFVDGVSPESAGLRVMPLMLGMIASSIAVGQAMARTGRYRPYPIAGTALAMLALLALTTIDAATPGSQIMLILLLVGAGVGATTPVLPVVAVNAAPPGQIGAASSSTAFSQSFGGAYGAALLGAVLNATFRAGLPPGVEARTFDAGRMAALPADTRAAVIGSFVHATHAVFLVAAALVAGAAVLTWFLPAVRLSARPGPPSPGPREVRAGL